MRRILKWLGIVVVTMVVSAAVTSFLIDEPLRRRIEEKINSALRGYSVHIAKLDFHPVGGSLDLEDLHHHTKCPS